MRFLRRLIVAALFLTALSLALLGGLLALELSSSARALAYPAEDAVPPRVLTVLQSSDRLHYGAHLVLGRALSLCPCTRGFAVVQYAKATPHARTPRQTALVTSDRPHTIEAAVRDLLHLGAAGVRRLADALL